MSKQEATADVCWYWPTTTPPFEKLERAGATLRFGDREMLLVVPWPGARPGEARSEKYRREFSEVLEALQSNRPMFHDGSWYLAYNSKEAQFAGLKSNGSRWAAEDIEALDFGAVVRALEEICSAPDRIKVSPFYNAEAA